MKIGFLTRSSDLNNGSTRVRAIQFVSHLQKAGVNVRVLPRDTRPGRHWQVKYLINAVRMARWADVILLQKPNQSKLLIDLLSFQNSRMVVDIDDAVWSPPQLLLDSTAAQTVSHSFATRLQYAVKRAKCVIAGSGYLAEIISSTCPEAKVSVVPPSVDLDAYNRTQAVRSTQAISIGWIGSGGNLVDLLTIAPALEAICDGIRARLCVISNERPNLKNTAYDFMKWSIETEVDSLRQCDVGIMPLADNERNRGRCGYKAIQCMALGMPVVCTPIGAGTEVVIHRTTGLHATTNEEWVSSLNQLIHDTDFRMKLGKNARSGVEKNYSVQANLSKLLEIFEYRMYMN